MYAYTHSLLDGYFCKTLDSSPTSCSPLIGLYRLLYTHTHHPHTYTHHTHHTQYVYSKGTVLDKTVEYLKDLISQNEQLASTAKLAEKSANALSLLQNQITVLEKENAFLR